MLPEYWGEKGVAQKN